MCVCVCVRYTLSCTFLTFVLVLSHLYRNRSYCKSTRILLGWYYAWFVAYVAMALIVLRTTQTFFHDAVEARDGIRQALPVFTGFICLIVIFQYLTSSERGIQSTNNAAVTPITKESAADAATAAVAAAAASSSSSEPSVQSIKPTLDQGAASMPEPTAPSMLVSAAVEPLLMQTSASSGPIVVAAVAAVAAAACSPAGPPPPPPPPPPLVAAAASTALAPTAAAATATAPTVAAASSSPPTSSLLSQIRSFKLGLKKPPPISAAASLLQTAAAAAADPPSIEKKIKKKIENNYLPEAEKSKRGHVHLSGASRHQIKLRS